MDRIDLLPIKAKALAKDEFMRTEYSMRDDELYIIMRDRVEGEYRVPLTYASHYKDIKNDILVEWRHDRNSVKEVWDHDGELYLMDFFTNADGMPFLDDIIPGSVFHDFKYDYHETPSRYCVMKYKQPLTTTRHRFGNNPPEYFYIVDDDRIDYDSDDFF